ncbi:hypothetical protein [Amycolatopsis keratiniphila]|uniref:hypothetical protein n=1 Tax=Amycolatopsis keratiniphila TaxID=129921 RepID=UPI00087CB153|nr:hypothetical protein [Amycolatopsis keratiniphila]OLZ58457.1 hypothetical protein BS330_11425 [Amycolatopsis keratiniphila subsp. nogabecina]SDU01099.1 hypothetical protein SAMN04489733_0359 [Amycolatopsis keratiniphila]
MKEPLYRRVNTRARNVHHDHGGDYRHQRTAKSETSSDLTRGSMGRRARRGLDYTPLFRFLLGKVGEDWDGVRDEAAARLDSPDPIHWLVARQPHERSDYVRIGEASYYSGLYVDDENRLRAVAPQLGADDLEPSCPCCTHTFNGVRFGRKYREPER